MNTEHLKELRKVMEPHSNLWSQVNTGDEGYDFIAFATAYTIPEEWRIPIPDQLRCLHLDQDDHLSFEELASWFGTTERQLRAFNRKRFFCRYCDSCLPDWGEHSCPREGILFLAGPAILDRFLREAYFSL